MDTRARMSPLTAFFIGLFGLGAVTVASGTVTLLYAMRIADENSTKVFGFLDTTVEGLPELLASLPPALGDMLNDRRAPEYASKIDVALRLVPEEDGVRPVLTVTNKGEQIVSLLALRVAALNANSVPVRDWTEVVATPLAIDNDWRGPLMPGSSRHIVLHRSRGPIDVESLQGAVEIADVRVWEGKKQM